MMGDVVASPDKALVGQVRGLVQVLDFLKDIKKVFIPPIPRFVFGGCCASKHHAPNTSAPDHPLKMITEHIRQRHTITKALVDSKATHFRVTDVLGIFAATHDSLTEKTRKLRTFTHKDNVHLTPAGYKLLAEEISWTATSSRPSSRVQPSSSETQQLRQVRKRCGGASKPPEDSGEHQQSPSGVEVAPATTPIGEIRENESFSLSSSTTNNPHVCTAAHAARKTLTTVIFRQTRYQPPLMK